MADSKNDGFLSRWSQRKQDLRQGKDVAEPITVNLAVESPKAENTLGKSAVTAKNLVEEQQDKPLLTLEDVKKLTADSDYSPFVAKNVSADVRNTAMKKLFTDPHYNVMDGLDIYIDDYSIPDPIPMAMLRQMTSAKFLNLFQAEEEAEAKEAADKATRKEAIEANTFVNAEVSTEALGLRDDANTVSIQSMPKSTLDVSNEQTTPISGKNDDHTDLRLQQNHAARPQKLGSGAE